MKSFKGKTSLVTGASSGIGLAIAADLAQRGSNLVLVARSRDRMEEIARDFRSRHGVKVEVVALDLGAAGAAAELYRQVGERGLTIDLLVNNAGFGRWGKFLADDLPTYSQMLDLNVRAVVELCHLFLPDMASRGDCGILNIGSTGSFIPVPYAAVYGATKAFVLSFSEALSFEYRDRGVQISVLCPGATESNFATVANANAKKKKEDASAASVAKVGLDALLNGKDVVIPGGFENQQVALLPRILPRSRIVKIVGGAFRNQLKARGVEV